LETPRGSAFICRHFTGDSTVDSRAPTERQKQSSLTDPGTTLFRYVARTSWTRRSEGSALPACAAYSKNASRIAASTLGSFGIPLGSSGETAGGTINPRGDLVRRSSVRDHAHFYGVHRNDDDEDGEDDDDDDGTRSHFRCASRLVRATRGRS